MESVFVYITTRDKEEAKVIGKQLVEKRLAAAVNIVTNMESVYWWKGEVKETTEATIIATTKTSRVKSLTAVVKALHSYECPCVVTVPIGANDPDYLGWIDDNVV